MEEGLPYRERSYTETTNSLKVFWNVLGSILLFSFSVPPISYVLVWYILIWSVGFYGVTRIRTVHSFQIQLSLEVITFFQFHIFSSYSVSIYLFISYSCSTAYIINAGNQLKTSKLFGWVTEIRWVIKKARRPAPSLLSGYCFIF